MENLEENSKNKKMKAAKSKSSKELDKKKSDLGKPKGLSVAPDNQQDPASQAYESQESTFGEKINKTVDWVKENPKKSVALGVLGIVALKAQATRKLLFWTASTAGTMLFQKEAKQAIGDVLTSDSSEVSTGTDKELSTPNVG